MAKAAAGPERYPVFQDGQVSDYRLAKQAYETAAKAGRLAEEAERVATGARLT